MGNKQTKYVEHRDLCKCRGSIATFRCGVFATHDMTTSNIREVLGYEVLTPYFRGCCGPLLENGKCGELYQYVACNKCITDNVYPYFTHLPNGWSTDPKCWIDYERPNVGKIKLP